MGIFSPPAAKPDTTMSPFEQAYAAVQAIDAEPHIDRVDSLKLGIAAKEKARDKANERLQEVFAAIRDAREIDGDTIALSLLQGSELPPVAADLVREKDQLNAGISALNRQINEAHYPLRKPWNELKREVADAIEPLVDDLYRRSQELIEGIEALYAESAALSRVAINGKIATLRQFSGTMLASGREFRRSFDFKKDIPVEPTLVAFNELPAIKAMKYGIPQTIVPPSVLDMERDVGR